MPVIGRYWLFVCIVCTSWLSTLSAKQKQNQTMEATNLEYSIKNIPLSNRDSYIKSLIQKTEHFIKRLRWKVFHFLSDSENDDQEKETFGFRTPRVPPKKDLLEGFKSDLYHMIKTIEFRNVRSNFQSVLRSNLRNIKNSDNVLVQADKTRNMYELGHNEYKKLLKDNVTKTYKTCNRLIVDNVNTEAAEIVDKLGLCDRVQGVAEKPAFITIKDHKPRFPNEVQCRLLNPCKSQVGKISKRHLETMNKKIREVTSLNQWRNTTDVLGWFKNIPNKSRSKFIKFDIVSFYPSISRDLLMKAIDFSKQYSEVTQDMIDTILNARKSFLFDNGKVWIKKNVETHFDVTEGSFDGAEVCELVGLYMLNKLKDIIKNGSVGCYRDDGLAVVQNHSARLADKLRKDIIKCFKDENLQITIDINLVKTDFLDVYLDLENDTYYPYKKPNDTPVYVHSKSNHPAAVLKQIPKMTSQRLSNLSCNEAEFKKSYAAYEEVLKKSGFKEKLVYIPEQGPNKRRNRKRNILWYNPPFDLQVKTNVAQTFLGLIDKYFPAHHRLHKILNRNTIKVSYSCMPNMGSHISYHNKKILQQNDTPPQRCNCNDRTLCPLPGRCQTPAIIYQGHIKTDDGESHKYIGLTEPPFKARWSDHRVSCNDRQYEVKTDLSKKVWELKDKGKVPSITWSVVRKTSPYESGSDHCNLCLWEKFYIMKTPGLLNTRKELVSKCRHANKFLLKNYKGRRK